MLSDPYGWWIEPFVANGFVRTALLAGLLAVLTTSVVGTWVVLRGMSFVGDALAHGVLPGIAIAFVAGVDTSVGAFVAALAMVAGINVVRSSSPLPDDTSIGVLFVGFLSLAVVVMSSAGGAYQGDLNRFLFGSILAVDDAQLVRQALAAAATIAGVVVLHRALLLDTFDPVQARLAGFRPAVVHGALLVLVAVAIVSSFEAVGNLLVFAFLVAPPAAASLLVRRVPLVMVTSVALGSGAVVIGILVSYHRRTATSATMALASVVVFVAVLVVRATVDGGRRVRARRSRAVSPPAAGRPA